MKCFMSALFSMTVLGLSLCPFARMKLLNEAHPARARRQGPVPTIALESAKL